MIETRRGVRGGTPCFVGTRITVSDVLDYLASGMTTSEIADDFPELTEQHVLLAKIRPEAASEPSASRWLIDS